jgi:hypothetical protein
MRPSSLICTTKDGLGPTSRWGCWTHHFRCILETWRIHRVLLTLPLLMNLPLFLLACITRLQFPPLSSARLPWTIWLYLSASLPLSLIIGVPISLTPVPLCLDVPPHILHGSYGHQLLHLHFLLFLTHHLLLLMIHWLGCLRLGIHTLVHGRIQIVKVVVVAQEGGGA